VTEFDEARRHYATARIARETARSGLAEAVETVKRLERDAARQTRFDTQGGVIGDDALADARREVRTRRAELTVARDAAARAGLDFAVMIDPTEAVRRLPDDVPIALFPLRLETRFVTAGGDQPAQRFLYVRVFPDDILVDSFQDRIGQAEYDKVVLYWTQWWRAGGDPAGHRAAWAAVVRGVGAGRAKWLIDQVVPLNASDEPVITTGAHVLVIRPPAPVPVAEHGAIEAFWARVWSTSGTERNQAFTDLSAAVGAVRAAEIETELEPVDLRDPAVKPSDDLMAVVAFLDLPAPSTLPMAQDAWGRPARVWMLPERLVLLGFHGDQQILLETGKPIPADLQVGPDPGAVGGDQIKADGPDLEVPDELAWLVDFDAAVDKGMGFEVNLTERNLPAAFFRIFVLGIRLGGDSEEAAGELSELITHHQCHRRGFSLLPQGRPTNNTDASTAGHTWWEDPDESFRHFFEPPTDDPDAWESRRDGAWLAGALGVERDVLKQSVNYYGTDQAEARAVNIALWPATLGYYMEQMMEPVFSEDTVHATRDFFNRFVIGRGTIPLVRVGRQPYGVLPATVWSRAAWWTDPRYIRGARALGLPDAGFLKRLWELGRRVDGSWEAMASTVSHVGRSGPTPQKALLDIVGLHPTSAEHYQRWAQSYAQEHNTLTFSSESVMGMATTAAQRYIREALHTLADLGWAPPPETTVPQLVQKIFLKQPNLLKGPLVEAELSDSKPLKVTRSDGRNYLDWLQWAARTSHDSLRTQDGFGDAVPTSLLYLMVHHALDLGYIDADLRLRREIMALSDDAFLASRREPTFIQVSPTGAASRWSNLYRPEPAITGDPTVRMSEYIPKVLQTRDPYLNTQLSALDTLKGASTGALERAFVEHLDCLSYRLDAWRLGVQAVQLAYMREDSTEEFGRGGVHIGAYGWLENVRADEAVPEPVDVDDELAVIFDRPEDPPLMRDPANYGHIHAPSLDHAVTAAILRNGHLADATPQTPDLLAVDISSERVRRAHTIIEGIRNGQPLGALLGYRLERSLHDEPTAYLDRLIYEFRRAFPLAGNRNSRTEVTDLDAGEITKVEARNVVDGAAFADHLARTGQDTYPYGLSGLPALGELVQPGSPSAAEIGVLVDRCVTEMRAGADAVADLMLAEGVYQVVRGNYDRAAGALDAVSKGTHPPLPEVSETPRNGTTLTHRVALHLRGGLSPADPSNTTPRAVGEPALAAWIATQLPDPATVFAKVSWGPSPSVTVGSETPSMAQLGLGPVDLFYLLDTGGAESAPGFDDLLIDYAERVGAPAPRHDAVFGLEYKPNVGAGNLTLFELTPLVRALRGVVLGARPLRPTDLAMQNEASTREDTGGVVRTDKVDAVLADLQATAAAVDAFVAEVDAAIGEGVDPEVARDAARDTIDDWIADFAAAVRRVLPFGLPTAVAAAAVEGRRARFASMRTALAELISRWQAKQAEYDDVMAEYAALPAEATDEDRIALLIKAGRVVSTMVIAPLPPLITDLETAVADLRDDLDGALIGLTALHDNAVSVGSTLIAVTAVLPTIAAADRTPFEIGGLRDSVLTLASELRDRAAALSADIEHRVAEATAALTEAAAAVGDKAQKAAERAAKALLGEAFILLPEFAVAASRLAEWNNVWTNRADLLTHLATGPDATPFPIDDWQHGIARVRERMRDVELTTLLGEALGAADPPALEALQFPYRAGDAWLGLRFPETMPDGSPFTVTGDKLLYSAVFATGAELDPTDPAVTYCGLLLDEWVEVVPGEEATSGLAFHFDRPNSEAPQSILLVTPPVHRGAWQWQDIVDTLHETLDFARLRAVEPSHVDASELAPLLPAVLSSVTTYPITASLNLSFNNNIHLLLAEDGQ